METSVARITAPVELSLFQPTSAVPLPTGDEQLRLGGGAGPLAPAPNCPGSCAGMRAGRERCW